MNCSRSVLFLLAGIAIPTQTLLAAAVALERQAAPDDASASDREDGALNAVIKGYSQQKIIYLDVDEEYTFRCRDSSNRVIRLVSVEAFRDDIVGRVRRAEIGVEVGGAPLHLTCAPYVMPTESHGIRIQADTTSDWLPLPKRVQFSVWDPVDPIVDTERFGFPIADYLLFSHGVQSYNEVVHLGRDDGDPRGTSIYHNYGIDLAGYEGRGEIVSCTNGEVVLLRPSGREAHHVTIQGDHGILWEYGHLDSVAPGVQKGARLRKGQRIGILGKKGASGNFSHLHLGTYLSRADLDHRVRNRRLNLYPWIVTAYQQRDHGTLYAVARPHQVTTAGQKVTLDGSNSMAFGTRIVSYRWEFRGGETLDGPKVEKAFETPGVYVATLRVRDDQGSEDVDFCRVKVFSRRAHEGRIPTIFMTHAPSRGVRVGQPVRFRFWLQAGDTAPIAVDFGDGTIIPQYASYSEVVHGFGTPGIHVVTAHTTINGKPVTQKQKVIVAGPPRESSGARDIDEATGKVETPAPHVTGRRSLDQR